MTTLNIEGRRVKVDDSFRDLSPEEQNKTVEEIASQLEIQSQVEGGGQMMQQVNRGIVDAVGGAVDFLNPFDEPHALNPFPNGTGSAREGLTRAMGAADIDVAQGEADGVWQNMQRGAGTAAASALPVGGIARGVSAARGTGNVIGNVADDVARSMGTVSGQAAEVGAGAVAAGAEQVAEDAGAPEWVQNTAAIVAPMSGPAAVAGARGASRILPGGVAAREAVRSTRAALAPYTKSGARDVARRRMQDLAGGSDRAERLASQISPDNPLNLTPAQQTGDENMMGLQNLAAEIDPNLREKLDVRARRSGEDAAGTIIDMGGEVENTRSYIANRQRQFEQGLTAMADDALARAERRLQSIGPESSESQNSLAVSREIDSALERATARERELWDAVPRGAQVDTANSRDLAQEIIDNTPRAQRGDIPRVVRQLLVEDGGLGETTTVNELHGLYSELRRVARSAMAGNDQNKNMARISNSVADAILTDLGAGGGQSQIGRAIDDARAYSAALHETFDRGAVGRLLKRTLDGDQSVDPELSLRRTVGRSGPEGAVSSRQINSAAGFDGREGQTAPAIQDYIRDRFQLSAVDAQGNFTAGTARRFFRDNQPLLQQYPDLREEILGAVANRENAEQIAQRVSDVIARSQKPRNSATATFLDGPASEAANSILRSRDPVRTARSLRNSAAKDRTGEALSGLKGAFVSQLVRGSRRTTGGRTQLDANRLQSMLDDDAMSRAMRVIFTPQEMGRIRKIAGDLSKVQNTEAGNVGGSLSGAKANTLIKTLAQVGGANLGAKAGGGNAGASLQAANIGSRRAERLVNMLAGDRASLIIADAIEDPELFRALLTDVGSVGFEKRAVPKLLPYLIGGGSVAATDDDEPLSLTLDDPGNQRRNASQ